MLKELLVTIIFAGFVIYRHKPSFIIMESKQLIVDKHQDCRVGTYHAPHYFLIRGTDKFVVELLNISGYNNFTDNISYQSVYRYNLMGYIGHIIDLDKKYESINGTCYILVRNNNPYPILIKGRYRYTSVWRYFLSEIAKNHESYNNIYND